MQTSSLFLALLGLAALAYLAGYGRSVRLARPLGGIRHLHSLPGYYASQSSIWALLPALLLLGCWLAFENAVIEHSVMAALPASEVPADAAQYNLTLNQIQNLANGALNGDHLSPALHAAAADYLRLQHKSRWMLSLLTLALAVLGAAVVLLRMTPQRRAREHVEQVFRRLFMGCAFFAVLITAGIFFSVVFESIQFFQKIPMHEFLFGLQWSPQTAIRADQVGAGGAFGMLPLFAGTLLISLIAMLVAVPVGLMSAIYLAEYANKRVRAIAKPTLEVLAGVPTVVYGFFAALTVAPAVRDLAASVGLNAASESALAAGLVMGVMIIPFVSSLSDDVINAVPQSLRDGSLGLGATHSETIRKVVFPAALPGIMGGILLAVSRAVGETMIVVMAAGLAAKLTANPLDAVTTVTVQIVTLLVGDQEFDSAKTLAAFALGLMLFLVTLGLNILALHIVRKYREQYD